MTKYSRPPEIESLHNTRKVAMKAVWLAIVVAAYPVVSNSRGGGGGSTSTGSHYVAPYTTKDGTYVQGHYQTNPNGTTSDNWSTKGNINPYTGKEGTVDPNKSKASDASSRSVDAKNASATDFASGNPEQSPVTSGVSNTRRRLVGQDEFQAKRAAQARGCLQPNATMIGKSPGTETYAVDCDGVTTQMRLICEFGQCRSD